VKVFWIIDFSGDSVLRHHAIEHRSHVIPLEDCPYQSLAR